MQQVDLSALVRETESLIEAAIPSNISLTFDLDADLPPIRADRSQLTQVLLNLALNAAEAIGSDSGRISISTACSRRPSESPGAEDTRAETPATVQLAIADSGGGMDEETRARIFDPFFTTKQSGRGLGLAAVDGILRNHHANCEVQSTTR